MHACERQVEGKRAAFVGLTRQHMEQGPAAARREVFSATLGARRASRDTPRV